MSVFARKSKPWSPAEDAYLAALWEEGKPLKSIAKTMGRTVGSIKSRRSALDLPARFETAPINQSLAGDRAYRDAMRDIAYEIPQPRDKAAALSDEARKVLETAFETFDGYRVSVSWRNSKGGLSLFAHGCVEANGPYLTAYGNKVRRALLEDG